jgi:hypothetical protein
MNQLRPHAYAQDGETSNISDSDDIWEIDDARFWTRFRKLHTDLHRIQEARTGVSMSRRQHSGTILEADFTPIDAKRLQMMLFDLHKLWYNGVYRSNSPQNRVLIL